MYSSGPLLAQLELEPRRARDCSCTFLQEPEEYRAFKFFHGIRTAGIRVLLRELTRQAPRERARARARDGLIIIGPAGDFALAIVAKRAGRAEIMYKLTGIPERKERGKGRELRARIRGGSHKGQGREKSGKQSGADSVVPQSRIETNTVQRAKSKRAGRAGPAKRATTEKRHRGRSHRDRITSDRPAHLAPLSDSSSRLAFPRSSARSALARRSSDVTPRFANGALRVRARERGREIFIAPIIDKWLSAPGAVHSFRILAGGLPRRSNKQPIIEIFPRTTRCITHEHVRNFETSDIKRVN